MFEVALDIALMLACAAFLAGFIDAIAGGGGLITLPALLLAGASPIEALSTNKVQGPFGSFTSAMSYAARGHVDLRAQAGPAALAFLGAAAGAGIATVMPSQHLRVILPVLLIGVALFFALKPGLGDIDRAERMRPALFNVLIVPLIGAYDGFLGPGTGSFYMIAYVMLAGHGLLKATAHTKVMNFATNIGAVTVFALFGKPWWLTGILMGLANVFGARCGALVAMRGGARTIKPLLVATSIAMAGKLIWDLF